MSVSPFDSGLYRDLFTDVETARLFTDTSEVRAMLLVLGTLAKVQGAQGIIPADAANAIHRASLEAQVDPTALRVETGQNGVPVPALIKAFRTEVGDPDAAQYVHWGSTSQDIIDTALVLRLRPALFRIEESLTRLIATLGHLADRHADTPMAGRSYGQNATPTSFGATVAAWGRPMLRHHDRLAALRPGLLCVSLSGAAGNSAALGPKAAQVRAALAEALDLTVPDGSWHSTRDTVAELAGWLTLLAGSVGKMGDDLILLSQTGIAEVSLGRIGASSTMPQKQNPVAPSVIVALARHITALNAAMQGALVHRQDRDGAAWFTEWLSLPPMIVGTAQAVKLAADLAQTLEPSIEKMAVNMTAPHDMIHAEALSFLLARTMRRIAAQSKIKFLCDEANATNTSLLALVARDFPKLDLARITDPAAYLGDASFQARDFATRAADLKTSEGLPACAASS